MDILQYIFSLHIVSPTSSPPVLSTPQPPDNPKSLGTRVGIPISEGSNEVHIVVDLHDTPQFNSYCDLMGDSEKDPELEEHQLDHDDENAIIGALNNNFDLGREPGDESDLDYDPSRDHQIPLYYMLTSKIDYFISDRVTF